MKPLLNYRLAYAWILCSFWLSILNAQQNYYLADAWILSSLCFLLKYQTTYSWILCSLCLNIMHSLLETMQPLLKYQIVSSYVPRNLCFNIMQAVLKYHTAFALISCSLCFSLLGASAQVACSLCFNVANLLLASAWILLLPLLECRSAVAYYHASSAW